MINVNSTQTRNSSGEPHSDTTRERIALNGTWQFRLDPDGTGEALGWHSPSTSFAAEITVPGAWQAQGFGEPSESLRHDYAGVAWYRKSVAIPAAWDEKSVTLRIGGAHRRTTVYVNGLLIGNHDGFSAPFAFDVLRALKCGAENTIAIRIENPAHPISEAPDVQDAAMPAGMLNYIGNWGGIHSDVSLEAAGQSRIVSACVTSDAQTEIVQVKLETTGSPAQIRVSIPGFAPVTAAVANNETVVEVPMPGARLWSPDDPHLYTATISLLRDGETVDQIEQRFGIRQITPRDGVLRLNGSPLYLRGFGDDNVEVLTGFPSASKEVHKERLQRAKDFGFNAVRFHSMTPPEAYFEAADEVGILVMAELPAAYTQYFFNHLDFLRREMSDILTAYRNHPSLLSLAFGNEFNLDWLKTEEDRKTFVGALAEFYQVAKSLAPETLIMSNDGFDLRPTDMVSLFGEPPGDIPTVRHEFGEYYCSLPDISQIDRITGVMEPTWLHVKKSWVESSGLAEDYPTYVHNSQRLQHLGRKFQIERVRHDGRITGYHYWLIVDFPGGTGEGDSWEEGWFDYFWEPKGVLPEQGREINSAVLPLISAGPGERTFWSNEGKTVELTVSNYGGGDLREAKLTWRVLANGNEVVDSGTLSISVTAGKVERIGEVTIKAPSNEAAQKLELVVEINASGKHYTNRWSFWAFPNDAVMRESPIPVTSTVKSAGLSQRYPFISDQPATAGGLLVTESLNAEMLVFLNSGGSVWLIAGEEQTGPMNKAAFFPASGGSQGTIIPEHPAINGFPHEGFCDLQFFNLISGGFYFPLDQWPTEIEPITGGIRTTSSFLSKSKDLSRFAYAFETRVGRGKLLVTSVRLVDQLGACPEAAYLFDRLLRYAASSAFSPDAAIDAARIMELCG